MRAATVVIERPARTTSALSSNAPALGAERKRTCSERAGRSWASTSVLAPRSAIAAR
jgi:hypothetical protein